MGPDLFRADRRTYMTELVVAFRKFAKSVSNIKLSIKKRWRKQFDRGGGWGGVPTTGITH
jgi:hypothetical protein